MNKMCFSRSPISLILLGVFLCQVNFIHAQEKTDPILLTIGSKNVTRSEFEKIYRKNNTKEATSNKSLQDYLELYINYKLKVREAEELSLDTASNFKNELSGYRKQLAQPYLTDKDMSDKLVKEAYKRMQTDIRASHVLIKVSPDALPKDTLKAYNRIIKIREMILKNGDFSKVARDSSEDPSAKENGGDLGFFTALQMVYPFEDAAFNAKQGEVTMPVRTRFGYHLIKVTDHRADPGEITVAHIMIKSGAKVSAEDSAKAKARIDELYKKIKEGAKFEEIAKESSEDNGSAKNGGVLPAFGSGRMVPEFEQAAFDLKQNGDFSSPVKTAYGWHIIKRIDKKPLGTLEETQGDIKGRISKDARADMGKASFIAKVKRDYGFQSYPKAKDEMAKDIDSTLLDATWAPSKSKEYSKTLFSLADQNFTQKDFAKYLSDHQTKKKGVNLQVVFNSMYDQYLDDACMSFKESRLEKEYPEFKSLMEEYRDGILLFELTDKKVWSKAVKDSVGLKGFYDKNKTKYMWPDRVEAVIYACSSKDAAKKVSKLAKKGNDHEATAQAVNQQLKSKNAVTTKNGRFVKGDNSTVDAVSPWKKGVYEIPNTKNDSAYVVEIKEFIPAQPKSLEESKGLVTAEYQTVLEKEWIETLRKKYPVKVNTEVLGTIK